MRSAYPGHYNRFRYYDPSIGRYISSEPIGQSGLLAAVGVARLDVAMATPGRQQEPVGFAPPNIFTYAGSNPAALVDRRGDRLLTAVSLAAAGACTAGAIAVNANDASQTAAALAALQRTRAQIGLLDDLIAGANAALADPCLSPEERANLLHNLAAFQDAKANLVSNLANAARSPAASSGSSGFLGPALQTCAGVAASVAAYAIITGP